MKNKSFLFKTDFYYRGEMKKLLFTTSVSLLLLQSVVFVQVEVKELQNVFERVMKKISYLPAYGQSV